MAWLCPPGPLLDQQVRALIAAHFLLEPHQVSPDASLVYDLGADSSDLLDIAITLGELLECDLDTRQLAQVTTLDDFCQLVRQACGVEP